MAKGYVLYNEKAGTDGGQRAIAAINYQLSSDVEFIEISNIKSYKTFFSGIEKNDYIIIVGGDGTLNRFANDTEGIPYTNEIYFFPSGTGNDLARDLGKGNNGSFFSVTDFIKNLPVVTVKGKNYRFINGIGYGIDGYCCEVGDIMRKSSSKPVNYSTIAIKGLFFHYKPTGARVTVDGVTRHYKKVWLAPTMNGRFYGGGMMPTPDQKRISDDKTLSTMIFHNAGKLKTLMIFPSLFKGEHTKHKKHVDILKGHNITVAFDRPSPLQIDGETILDVHSYSVAAKMPLTHTDIGLKAHN